MTIRPITPPPGANWTEWHAARDAEVRLHERDEVLSEVEEYLHGWHNDAIYDPKWRELEDRLRSRT